MRTVTIELNLFELHKVVDGLRVRTETVKAIIAGDSAVILDCDTKRKEFPNADWAAVLVSHLKLTERLQNLVTQEERDASSR